MADTIDVLRTLVNKDDARRWAAVNNAKITEKGSTIIIDEYVLVFDDSIDGRLVLVERRVPEGNAL